LRNIEYPRTKLKQKCRLIYRASYLSPWSTAVFQDLILSQLEKKVPVFDVNCQSTNVFTGANRLSPSCSRLIQFMRHILFLDGCLMLFPHKYRSLEWSLSLCFAHQNPACNSSLNIRHTCPAYLILLNLTTRTIFEDD